MSRKANVKAPNQPAAAKPLGPHTRSTVDVRDRKSLDVLDGLVKDGQYVSGEELAIAIETNPGQTLPEGLREYLCRFLRGKIHKKRGRKQTDKVIPWLREYVVAPAYKEILAQIRSERTARGQQRTARGSLAPHEEAARLIKERYGSLFPNASPKRIANILSSRKFR